MARNFVDLSYKRSDLKQVRSGPQYGEAKL
jgi:hypothetical protein